MIGLLGRILANRLVAVATILTVGPVVFATALAQPQTHRADYKVSLLGIPMASINFIIRIDGASYEISGNLQTSFLAEIIEPTRGTILSSGQISGEKFQAKEFDIQYTSGKKRYRAAMTLSGGNVRSSLVEPSKKKPSNWVPVTNAHRRSVVDPLAGLIFPRGIKPCPQTIAVYDAESRFDLKLSPVGVRPYSTKGFSGDALVCSMSFVPKAGYRKDNSQIDYVRKLKGMELWFAVHPEGGYSAPVYAKIPTKVGIMIVAAARFGS